MLPSPRHYQRKIDFCLAYGEFCGNVGQIYSAALDVFLAPLSARHPSYYYVSYAKNTFSPPELEHQPPTPFRRGTVPFIPVSGTSQNPHQGVGLLQHRPDPHHCQGPPGQSRPADQRHDHSRTPRHRHQQDHSTYRFTTGTQKDSCLIGHILTACVKKSIVRRCSFSLHFQTVRRNLYF